MRPARALPYEIEVTGAVRVAEASVELAFKNTGKAAVVLQVRSQLNLGGPWSYTVGAEDELAGTLGFSALGAGLGYDFAVYGPNGFLRTLAGSLVGATKMELVTAVSYEVERNSLTLTVVNKGSSDCPISVLNGYTKVATTAMVGVGKSFVHTVALGKTYGWYDLLVTSNVDAVFMRQVAGHVENGKASMTDPLIGG